jgi:hypothetical protein
MRQLILLLLGLSVSCAYAKAGGDDDKSAPLFADNEIVEVTITAPFDEIMSSRSLDDELQGTLVYRDAASGQDVTLNIGIRARGKFRRQKDICTFAPLRLNFRKTKDTLFAKSDKMKLVTHCRQRSSAYEQAVVKEYIAYRILNTLTDWSFRARLLKARYVESTSGEEIADTYAVLIEHDKQLAKRIGMKVDDSESTTVAALDARHTNLVSVFQYLIGNTDFSPIKGVPGDSCCHNYVLLKSDDQQISVPYDFDVTGIVAPPHAAPNPRFRLNSVRERLYRGRCANNERLEATLQQFRDQRQAIESLVIDQPALSKRERKRTLRYIDDFYKTVDSPRRVNDRLLEACLKS